MQAGGTLRQYNGGYSDYEAVMLEEQATAIKANKPVVKEEPKATNKKKMTYSERLELQLLTKKLPARKLKLKCWGWRLTAVAVTL